jgi:hypothetical protein
MADYYHLISNAIAALDEKGSEARHAFYDRARAILADKLEKAAPPLPETIIEQERLALEDAISRVEANATHSEVTWPLSDGFQTQEDAVSRVEANATHSEVTWPLSDDLQTQSDHTEGYIRKPTMEAPAAESGAKLERERRFAFWGFLILAVVWIGDLFYEPPTFSTWYDWMRLGGVILFPTMTILSYFIMRKKFSVEEEERAYIISAPIVLVGTVVVTVALYWTFGRLAATP